MRSRDSSGWPTIAAFASVCAGTQLLWLTYAPIDTGTAHYYGVSTSAVGWLAEIFPLLYVALAIPAGRLLDNHFRPALLAGGALMAAGGVLRLGGQTFAWAMAGQLAVAVAQPVVVSAMGKVSAGYLPVDRRAAGIAVASAGSFAGMLLALILGPTLGAHGQIERLLVVQAALGVFAAVALALTLRRPGYVGEESVAIEGSAVRGLWALPEMRILCGLAFVGFGVFVALATWLQTLLHPAGISEQSAGALLVAMVVAGIAGCALLPPLIARRGAAGDPHCRRAAGRFGRRHRWGNDLDGWKSRRAGGGPGRPGPRRRAPGGVPRHGCGLTAGRAARHPVPLARR